MDGLPHAIWSGSFKILGVEIKCHTLSDGQRIIEPESVADFVRALHDAKVPDDPRDHADTVAFANWKAGK